MPANASRRERLVTAEEHTPDSEVSADVVRILTPLLGPHTARRALAMVCKRAGKDASHLGPEDLPMAHQTLRPMLRTLVGKEVAIRVLADLGAPSAGESFA